MAMAFLSPRTLVPARGSLRTACRAAPSLARAVHSLPPYERQVAPELGGAAPFLSREAVHLVGTVYRQGLIARLNQTVQGTHMENLPIADVAIDAAQNPKFIHTYGYAAEVLNNAFFLHNLKRRAEGEAPGVPGEELLARIEQDYESLPALKSQFSAAALGMVQAGWLWFVRDQTGRLGIIPSLGRSTLLVSKQHKRGLHDFEATLMDLPPQEEGADEAQPSPAATYGSSDEPEANYVPFARLASARDKSKVGQDLTPLFCLSLHEHSWLPDYGIWGKEDYLVNFWHSLDWDKVSKAYSHIPTTAPKEA